MSDPAQRPALIEQRLGAALAPLRLDIVDDSHKHVGHVDAGGAGHFTVTLVSAAFEGKGLIQRHRLVYAAVGDLMNSEIHALSIHALTPAEAGIS